MRRRPGSSSPDADHPPARPDARATESAPFGVRTALVDLAVSTSGGAVVRIHLGRYGTRRPRTPLERLVASELREFMHGARREFSFPIRTAGTGFEEQVWSEVQGIPFGATTTYGAIAQRLGQPGAARAVGSANGRNPIPIVIPCHRVVAAGGGLGGYGGGLELKRRLLALEARTAGLRLEPGGYAG
jgi:methylated-DNA-[protein]-cysteine S-methyltransferase